MRGNNKMTTVYQNLDQQFIHGQWQAGTSTRIIKNIKVGDKNQYRTIERVKRYFK